MLVAERYEHIVRVVNERGSIRVTELSELFAVTEETIRRDLAYLETQGRLKRSHGGAVSLKTTQQAEIPYTEREITNLEEKHRIANAAAEQVEAGDKIWLDASSTAWYMAEMLPDIPLTVLTNSMKVALSLAGKEQIEVICTGGTLAPRSLSFVGHLTEQMLEPYHVTKAFLSCKGLHVEQGLSESNAMQARVKQTIIGKADRIFMLIDYSKFGHRAFSKVAELDQIDAIICDDKAPAEQLEWLGKNYKRIQIIQV